MPSLSLHFYITLHSFKGEADEKKRSWQKLKEGVERWGKKQINNKKE